MTTAKSEYSAQDVVMSSGAEDVAPTASTLPASQDPTSTESAAGKRTESIGQQSKRSFGRRKRDHSTGSRRRGRRGDSANEKSARPATGSRTNLGEEPKPKKKSGLFALLCCGSSDSTPGADAHDAAQPAKPVSKPLQTRTQPSAQAGTQAGVSNANTSAEESKEVIDEKAAQQQLYANGSNVEPRTSAADPEKVPGDALAGASPPTLQRSEVDPATSTRAYDHTSSGITPLVTGGAALGGASLLAAGQNPSVQVQAPTPTVPQQEEDNLISDRTAEQRSRDDDIEMKESNVLTEKEAQKEIDDMAHAHDDDPSIAQNATGLPPPPGPPPASDGTYPSAATSLVSTPEGTSKWLLPATRPEHKGRKCLVLDLDETLVHSSFKVSSSTVRGSSIHLLTKFIDPAPSRLYHTGRD